MPKTSTLGSGAILEMTIASFEDGKKLLKAVTKEVKGIEITKGQDAINVIKNMVASVILSDEIDSALKPCLDRSTYNNKRITQETFEDEIARGDYLMVLKEVLEYNLTPFFSNLLSMLKDIEKQMANVQKLK